ncbi:MAG: hypothetical protein EAZ30_17340 [Betaproteobacteria bacterium]|nr:MAG: hypothetical protein EAZ30_17340 [Betaproteobacteria bacterium]
MNAMSAIKQVAAAALLALAALVCAWLAGANHNEQKWLAKQAKVERDAHAQYQAEIKRGEEAAATYLADAVLLRGKFTDLKEKFDGLKKRIPLAVGAAGGSVCGVGPALLQAPPVAGEGGTVNAAPLVLTAGAVWMWNSSLAGADQPAGACSAVDTTEAACAVATHITLDDAWASHATNAQICAENRLAHQRLIDFLNQREPRPERVKP